MSEAFQRDHARPRAQQFLERDGIRRIWARDPTVWTESNPASADARTHAAIANRLGWLNAPELFQRSRERLTSAADMARSDGVTTACLLGMGGSSLCAEVFEPDRTAEGDISIQVLDTTDEASVNDVVRTLDFTKTLFLVASKSGTTIEVASLFRFFWAKVSSALGAQARRHFVAITDPGTPLERLAREKGFRDVFLNAPDIGGRFSALSFFGLVPAALMGFNVHGLLEAGGEMAEGCRQENLTNPGLALGAFLGAGALIGRDKLTVLLPPSLSRLGLWIEQLVAESTGKSGTGLLPIVDETFDEPTTYGNDRLFVLLETEDERVDSAIVDALQVASHPVLRLSMRSTALGAEFFRWEFATAAAGALLGVNPFDEPNVQSAKDRTRAVLDEYVRSGSFAAHTPLAADERLQVYATAAFQAPDAAGVVRRALVGLGTGHYVAFLSYLPPAEETSAEIAAVRRALRHRFRIATTFGIGPRYLHSTGQYHKGGPGGGLHFVLTADDATSTMIPGAEYSFSTLKRAQALGDYEALLSLGRPAVRIHLPGEPAAQAAALRSLFAAALRHD